MSKLKNVKKVIIGLFIVSLFFSFFSHNAISATTIGDTTFPADVGKKYTWKAILPDEIKGTKLTYTIESIDQGVHNSIDALIVYCTIIIIAPNGGSLTKENNSLYMAANNTQNYLNFVNHVWGQVIIPTPINLTLVAEDVGGSKYALIYSIVDNTIILNYQDGISEEYTFNTKGFLTIVLSKDDGIILSRAVLDTGGDDAIPFGNYFLIFMVISVIALVYLKKQKIK